MTRQRSMLPDRKVTVGAIAGSVGIIVVWLISDVGGIKVPPDIAVAISTVVTFAVQYIVPNRE